MAPKQKPGRSVQSVQTPPDFMDAMKRHLGIRQFAIDLAASHDNSQAGLCFTEEDNSLIQEWPKVGWCWLNPPYADIRPWVEKASYAAMEGTKIAMLVPASVGSNWWDTFVHDIAYVSCLSPRLTFVGHKNPYPKDLALLLYAPFLRGGYTTWRWKA
ncbi:MAG: phage N-6-adenine-methyltransferase [Actinobacteria bacterium]|nr:phage N-6-adenine-methyltransferase [Actinomycetota bacterium]